ncbi:MAG TPA: hypothetical protein VLT32_18530 [Candidatus Sulfomarinibacteraceae bacterium]|nr:hypothetical protein [Candidatus Sulfomarinibacteraceae bacterium]
MVEFLTLFVGLVIGVHDVAVTVSEPVARVEIRRDGVVLTTLEGEPWRANCDLGRDLRPARLEAVAFDREGREIGRDLQWLNLPGERARASIVALRDEANRVVAAQLSWSSPELVRPRRIEVELDGEPLRVRAPYRIDLGDVPRDSVHVLTADFDFGSGVVVRRELIFGGDFSGDHDSGLTAVAVRLENADELPAPETMAGWFTSGGETLRVAGSERPEARVVVVRDPTVVLRLADMTPELERRRKRAARNDGRRRDLDAFDEDVELRLLSPEPVASSGREGAPLLFPYSEDPAPGPDGVVAAAVEHAPASLLGGPLMMADAVAMAGLRAAEDNRRRAVVVLLGARREDGSRFPPEVARRYLADLRVHLEVWDLSGPAAEPLPGWGEARPVDTVDDLVRAARRLQDALDDQRIVWLAGRRLPQEIGLSAEAKGISLVE